jgi:iron complex transport system ATP-binding protein
MMIIENLNFAYNSRNVLKNITFRVDSGDMFFILGPNGSGKTTLLKCISGVLKSSGNVWICGKELRNLSRIEIARKVAYVPQRVEICNLSVFDAILLGRRPYIRWGVGEEDIEIVKRIIRTFELDEFAFRSLTELSGGELQKVMIARAMAQEPNILLLDEPTNNLDLRNQIEVMNRVRRVVKEKGISAIITMHDLNIASIYADRIVMVKDGEIVDEGGVEVLTPRSIKEVYGVDVEVSNHNGVPVILPRFRSEEPINIK